MWWTGRTPKVGGGGGESGGGESGGGESGGGSSGFYNIFKV